MTYRSTIHRRRAGSSSRYFAASGRTKMISVMVIMPFTVQFDSPCISRDTARARIQTFASSTGVRPIDRIVSPVEFVLSGP